MSRNALKVLALGLLAAAMPTLGCTRAGTPMTGDLAPRARYDCLIIPNAEHPDNVITSEGFPTYYRADGAPQDDPVRPKASVPFPSMGTTFTVSVFDLEPSRAIAAINAVMGRLTDLTNKLNVFDAESETSVVNRDAGTRAVPIDDDLEARIRYSRRAAELSGGVFDPTVGPLTSLWRANRKAGRVPGDDEIAKAKALVGFDKVLVAGRRGAWTVKFAKPGQAFDFGGIAKGWATEEAVKVLLQYGSRSAVIFSGDARVIGRRPNRTPFRVGISNPRPPHETLYVVPLTNACIDTSGYYEQFTMIDGKRYSHIIDPRSGRAIPGLASVSVVGPDATWCDALSTTIGILGVDEGLKLIERVNKGEKLPVTSSPSQGEGG